MTDEKAHPKDSEQDSANHSSSSGEMPNRNNEEKKKARDKSDLHFISDVPLEVSVELGRIDLSLRDLLSLKKGSVLELDKLAGEPLEILINDKLVCRGEVIVINERYGIRMTDIIKPAFDIDLDSHQGGGHRFA